MVLFPRIVKMIIKISQRVFVGERLSQDPDWVGHAFDACLFLC